MALLGATVVARRGRRRCWRCPRHSPRRTKEKKAKNLAIIEQLGMPGRVVGATAVQLRDDSSTCTGLHAPRSRLGRPVQGRRGSARDVASVEPDVFPGFCSRTHVWPSDSRPEFRTHEGVRGSVCRSGVEHHGVIWTAVGSSIRDDSRLRIQVWRRSGVISPSRPAAAGDAAAGAGGVASGASRTELPGVRWP